MRLNLGSGYEVLGGDWVGIDLDPDTPATYNLDVRDLSGWSDGSVEEIRAVDILEHLSYRDTVPALREWARVLAPGGRMYVQVPAADKIMETWHTATTYSRRTDLALGAWFVGDAQERLVRRSPESLDDVPLMMVAAYLLLGGHFDGQYTRNSERWYLNAHHALFDEETIRWATEQAGLVVESLRVSKHPNYQVWMVKP